MSPITSDVLAIAELLAVYLPLPPGRERLDDPRFTAFFHARPDPFRNLVQRLRLTPESVASTVAEVRALYRARGTTETTWEVGPSSTPADLEARLIAEGMTPDPVEPELAGMVLNRPPTDAGAGVRVERVTTLDAFRTLRLIYQRCFEQSAPEPTDTEIAEDFERRRGHEDYLVRYLAFVDGVPVAAAEAIFLDHAVVLTGGATLPEARGKGVYRALVQQRWEDAVARGTPVLVVQAGAMSRPVLERLGFVEVARVKVLRDRFG